MIRYKRVVSTKTRKIVIATHFTTLYIGVDNEPARIISDKAFQDANYLWQLILEKINNEEVVDDYTVITTSIMEYKIKQSSWGSSILYRQLGGNHYKTYDNYILYSAVSINGWLAFFKAD